MNTTEHQQRAIETLSRSVCVDAGAGSGKTHVLIEHMLHILEHTDTSLDRIVAITFTRKATAEMKDRLRREFRKRASAGDGRAQQWREFERRVDTARIQTIDGFCASLLRAHALSIDLDPDFAVLNEAEAAVLQSLSSAERYADLLAAGHAGALRLAAEFGTWKVTQELEGMLASPHPWIRAGAAYSGMDVKDIQEENKKRATEVLNEFVLCFPKSATRRLIERTLRDAEGACTKPDDGREVLRQSILRAFQSIDNMQTPGEIREELTTLFSDRIGSTRGTNWSSADVLARVKAAQEEIKEWIKTFAIIPDPGTELSLKAAQHVRDALDVFQEVYAAHETAKTRRNALDFSNLLERTVEMLQHRPDILNRAAGSIDHILIDEFQDTNELQYELAQLLTGESKATLFLVGDAKQSIYRFRGADVHMFQRARADAEENVPLNRNFRSLAPVLSFVGDFFAKTQLLEAVEPDFQGLEAHRCSKDPVCVEVLMPEQTDDDSAETVRRLEAQLVANRITEWLHADPPLEIDDPDTGERRALEPGDIAILFRSGQTVSVYEEALRRANVESQIVEGNLFYKAQEISDLRNLLAVTVDPHDEMALVGYLRSPLAALSDESLFLLARPGSLGAGFRDGSFQLDDPAQQSRLTNARSLLDSMRQLRELHPADWLREAVGRTQLEAVLRKQPYPRQKIANVRKLIEQAESLGTGEPLRLHTFLRMMNNHVKKPPREGEAVTELHRAVSLLTIHKSKGLEFPVVILAEMSAAKGGGRDGITFPMHPRAGVSARLVTTAKKDPTTPLSHAIKLLEAEEEAAEEARVLYVAMTRARERLVLCLGPRGRTGSWHKHMDEFLNLASCIHGEPIEGDGWAATVSRKPSSVKMDETVAHTEAEISEIWPKSWEPLEIESPGLSVSISSLLELDEPWDEAKGASGPAVSARPREALAFGQATHRLFELWDFSRDAEPPVERVLRELRPRPDRHRDWASRLPALAEQFRQSPLLEQLAGDATFQKEVPFVLRAGPCVVNGVLDVLCSDGTIIDYKTGLPQKGNRERYEKQMHIYGHAVHQLLGLPLSKAVLYYVETGEMYEIPLHPKKCAEVFDRLMENHANSFQH